ncbi:hypothetical protein [Winogradskyella forsetii]|uniref:hypothetical protein n=1 Tax=Winogradskyella forsetii TaxID=2686077 RepID=UPI0015BB8B98|nr:hypothetical protein [Winogradskyella forsetii]
MEWLKKNIIGVLIVAVLLILLAFATGLLVKNWPLITFDNEFKITDVFSIIFSIALALLIPYFIKYFIEKGSKVNEMILGEVERYRDHLELTHSRFFSIYQSEKITDENKSELNIYCEMLDSKFEILSTVLKERCKEGADKYVEELKTNQIEFWRALTSIEINSLEVKAIHPTTFMKEIKCHQNITDTIMKINLFVTSY